jgi:phosphotransferase system IIA component
VSVYPSPATQSTIVSVSLPKEGHISIDLFDLNGKHIAKLRESREFDKGNHPIELNLSNINSGVYSLSIVIENQVITKKLVILSK